ncbi:MAG TPA: ATP-binding protein [Polyangiales bacterium]|nr:ATP-binding protein [Polyangiales bacterium]
MSEQSQLMEQYFALNLGLLCTARRDSNTFDNLNPAWERTLGWTIEELTSRSFMEFVHPEDLERTIELISSMDEGHAAINFENRYLHKNGSWVWLSWVGVLRDGTFYSSAIDITAYKEAVERNRILTEEKIATERLAVMGQLAGGMAHELRHPLGTIRNAAYYLNMVLEQPGPKVQEMLQLLTREVDAAERVIQSLLDFGSPKPPNREKVRLPELLKALVSTLQHPPGVEAVVNVANALPVVLADPRHLEQAFRNILINAVQALGERGQLSVRIAQPNQTHVEVAITDTGRGMTPQDRARMFEPLFTTKAKGIGLGLALAKLLIEGHDGTISAQSELGKGTTMVVTLPAPRLATEG